MFRKIFGKNKKESTIRDITVKILYPIIKEYSEWYDEHGLHLPPDYKNDPTEWTEALHKIERCFRILYEDLNEYGEYWAAKNRWREFGQSDGEAINEIEKEIKKGLTLFGSQLVYMIDPKWTQLKNGKYSKDEKRKQRKNRS